MFFLAKQPIFSSRFDSGAIAAHITALVFIITALNLFLVTRIFKHWHKKRHKHMLVFVLILLTVNGGVLLYLKNFIHQMSFRMPVQDVLVKNPAPPLRNFSFLKNYKILRSSKRNTYWARDNDDAIYCLKGGNPPQLYDSSFYIIMQNEGKSLTNDSHLIQIARFMILLDYSESEPVYFESPEQMADFFANRPDPTMKDIGRRLKNLIPREKNPDPYYGSQESDYPEKPLNIKDMMAQVSPPDFHGGYSGGTEFSLYTYSMRFREFARWTFNVIPDGEIIVEKSVTTMEPPPVSAQEPQTAPGG